jgi:hypothetical protein
MFIRAKDYDKFIVKVRIEIGKELGLDEDKEAYIELKEIPTIETLQLKEMTTKGEIELLKYFRELLPNIITDHNLYITEDNKMKNDDVVALLFEKNTLAMKVIGEYLEKTFFISAPKTKGKSKV